MSAPAIYSQTEEAKHRATLDQRDAQNRKKQQDIEASGRERFILASENGTRFAIVVDNAGNLSTVAA